jgi:PAS domain S-box-containing protein
MIPHDDTGLSLFRAFFEGHAVAKILVDPQARTLVATNYAACALYGFSREEIRRSLVWDMTVALLEAVRENMRHFVVRDISCRRQTEDFLRKSEEEFWATAE